MVKQISSNSIFFIGKIYEIRYQLSLIDDQSISLYDYIQKQAANYRSSLN